MINPDTLREIQRLMDESHGEMYDPRVNERRIAALLGIDAEALPEASGEKDQGADGNTSEA